METLVPDFYILMEGGDYTDEPDDEIGFFKTEEAAEAAAREIEECGLPEGGYVYVLGMIFEENLPPSSIG